MVWPVGLSLENTTVDVAVLATGFAPLTFEVIWQLPHCVLEYVMPLFTNQAACGAPWQVQFQVDIAAPTGPPGYTWGGEGVWVDSTTLVPNTTVNISARTAPGMTRAPWWALGSSARAPRTARGTRRRRSPL
jgi:hypothetical protein